MQIGHMGRDVVAANNFLKFEHEIHIAAQHNNPDLLEVATKSGGGFYHLDNICDPQAVAKCAVESGAELFYLNSDDALAADVVSRVSEEVPEIMLASPDRNGSRHEWDKFDSRSIIAEVDPSYNPEYITATSDGEIVEAIDYFRASEREIVVKPKGLTGGKGVKVMGPHLGDFDAAERYAKSVIENPSQTGVVLEEKLVGKEFTIQSYTDGKTMIAPPVTYDYPYREEGDKGPGTGGMGCFTMGKGEQMPFLTKEDYNDALDVMKRVLLKLDQNGRDFKGTHYGSFFKTKEGLKVVEFNARMGDPEGINIVELLEDDIDLGNVLEKIAKKELNQKDVRFKDMASAVIYLVSPDYAYRSGPQYDFEVDLEGIKSGSCRTHFVAAEQVSSGRYRSIGSSRVLAISALASTPWEARELIHETIKSNVKGPLQFRKDVASKSYIQSLAL